MAGVEIQIKYDDRQVQLLLHRIQQRVGNLRPIMSVIGETIKTSIVKNFERGGRYSQAGSVKGGSKKWEPLSEATLAKKRNKNRILIEKGHLMNSINYRASSDSVEVGTNKVYAAIHQFGIGERSSLAKRRRFAGIPARPYLVIQAEDTREIKDYLRSYILAL